MGWVDQEELAVRLVCRRSGRQRRLFEAPRDQIFPIGGCHQPMWVFDAGVCLGDGVCRRVDCNDAVCGAQRYVDRRIGQRHVCNTRQQQTGHRCFQNKLH